MTGKPQNWKQKYLNNLDQLDKQEQQYQQLMSLLVKAILRISRIAEGSDSQLDKQLHGLRALVSQDVLSKRNLSVVVDALEGQVKRMDTLKGERNTQVLGALRSMLEQLKALKPDHASKQQIKAFSKILQPSNIKGGGLGTLLEGLAGLQQQTLQYDESTDPPPSFWQRLFQRNNDSKGIQPESSSEPIDVSESEKLDQASYIDEDGLSDELPLIEGEYSSVSEVEIQGTLVEPPFSKFSEAICALLSELLRQIEPAPLVKDNYQLALEQIDNGLNWYELVATLENVSLVVISALDLYQQEFQQFLLQLNERLEEAGQLISATQGQQDANLDAGRGLRDTLRKHAAAMQQSVEQASDIRQLKAEVSGRLEQVLATVDQHQVEEQQRADSLKDQLNTLVERVNTMEADAVVAEQRIEEQRQLALRDVLTQLPNREAYQQRAVQEADRWRRYHRPLSLVMCDIDLFKSVNDTYGHLAGDKALRIIAKSLQKRLRKSDFIARFGGEEFIILMPETTGRHAFKVVDAVREAIANCPFHFKEQPVSITLSFGISEFTENDEEKDVLIRADKALYQAKEKGRNCCVLE